MNTNPFSRAFRGMGNLFEYNKTWAIILLVLGALGGFLQLFPGGTTSTTSTSSSASVPATTSTSTEVVAIILIVAMLALGIFLVALMSAYIQGLSTYIAWKTSRKETVGINDAFSAVTQRIWTIMAIEVLTGLKVLGGLLLFIVPGIRAALRYQLAIFPVFDEGKNARNAMAASKSLAQGHLMEIFGVGTVGAIVPILGSLLQLGGQSVLYPELKQLENYEGPKPKVHWLNYLGIILFIFLFSLFFLLIWFIARATS